YIHLGEEVTTRNSTYTCYGNILSINAPKRLVYDVLPYFDGDMDQVAIVFGIQQLQYILNLLDQEKIHAITDLRKYIRKNNGSKVINKTLLIPKEYLSPKISIDDIKAIYPYDMEICSNEKIERVILSKDPKYAVVFYVPTFAGSGKVEFLYISGAVDGEIFGFDVKGNVRLNGIALNPKGKYIINKNELKKIGDMVD
ncbi:MAG: hypothetical protein P1P88_14085, partial [Bacteroidales bacterium]|nr:hypothetical protein [Bacteroidales bacterium]